MSIIASGIVALLERVATVVTVPRVRALHLPPSVADGSRDGEFCAIELEDGSLGMSFVLLGFAAVNALTRHLFDRSGFEPLPVSGSLGDLDLEPGDHLGMIGLFPPLVRQVLATGADLTVLELRADLVGPRDGWHVTLDADELAHCNKILSTSTVLLNDTLDEMLERCRHAERVALVGPGAGCLPDTLFARGVTLLGGSWIVDAAAFKTALTAGRPWGSFTSKFALGAQDYPGVEQLLAAALGKSSPRSV